MKLREILWKDTVIEKLDTKHGVETDEVEEVLFTRPHVRRAERGRVRGEDLYIAYGRTRSGRFLIVFFLGKQGGLAMPISARDMTMSERSYYERHAT